MSVPFYTVFYLLVAATGYLTYITRYSPSSQSGDSSKPNTTKSVTFASFQKLYLVVYTLVMLGDWLQGPYVYALYDSYGYSQHDNAVLFVVGFGSFNGTDFIRFVTINSDNSEKEILNFFKILEDFVLENQEELLNATLIES